MKWWRMLWLRNGSSEDLEEAKRRLEAIEDDDVKVAALDRRVQRIRRENGLAPAIIRVLRVR